MAAFMGVRESLMPSADKRKRRRKDSGGGGLETSAASVAAPSTAKAPIEGKFDLRFFKRVLSVKV